VSEMSKFIDRLQQVFQPLPKSMGFKTASNDQTRPKIQLVVFISGGKSKSLQTELEKADALILPATMIGIDKIIWGMWLSKGNTEEVEKSIKSSADFIVLPANGEVLPPDKKVGKILQVEASITDVLLRTVNELPIDAVLLSEDGEGEPSFTWKRLMLIQRFSSLLNKPLLIKVIPSIKDIELQQIWEAGVSGVIVAADTEQAEAISQNLRHVIDKLSFPSRRKKEKSLAILPRVESKPEEPEEDDGDDD
jgi:hypothetical protein